MSWDEALHPRGHGGKFTGKGLGRMADVAVADAPQVVRTREQAREHRTPVGMAVGTYPHPKPSAYGSNLWGHSYGSFGITGASAKVMGLHGYDTEQADLAVGGPDMTRYATTMLRTMHDNPGVHETLYHGEVNQRFANAKAGDVVDLPLTATSADKDTADGYAIDYNEGRNGIEHRKGVMLEFPPGTRFFGYSLSSIGHPEHDDPDPAYQDKHFWDEAIVAGRFKVAERIPSPYPKGRDTLRLVQTHVFNPDTGKMEPI